MLSCDGHPEVPTSCLNQCSRKLIGQKSLVVECSAKGLVSHPFKMAARIKLLSWSKQLHEKYSTSDSLPAMCRDLIGLRISGLKSTPRPV